VVILPAAVQGETAPDALLAAFDRVARWVRGDAEWAGIALAAPDVVIVGRGGGSREDLWAFNHEQVARAIAACAVPTISAVGHETDFTIADFVADVRAATPSVAAETAVPVLADLVQFVAKLGGVMIDGLQDRIEVGSRELHRRADGLSQRARRVTERRRARTEQIVSRLVQRAPRLIERRKAQVEAFGARLDALSPLAVLGRGFAVARRIDGKALGKRNAFTVGTKFDLLLQDGRVRATADSIHTDAPHLLKDKPS
jgi:exodeoxyribonuclease VII large subunit